MVVKRTDADFTEPGFRLLVAACVGAIAAAYCYASMSAGGGVRPASDFTWHWLAGRALLKGQDPYVVVQFGGAYALDMPYLYPLTAAILGVPFALFSSPVVAATAFIGLSSALLAWALSREGYARFPLFLSIPFLWACNSGQQSPFVTAGALLPALGWATAVKPNIGIAALSYASSRVTIVGILMFGAIAFVVNPNWVGEWLSMLPHRPQGLYRSPLTTLGGALVLLAALRWRRPEARLLLVLAIVPQQLLFYDQLLLWLVPRTWRESATLSALSIAALLLGNSAFPLGAGYQRIVDAYAPAIVALLFLPCLIMVLRRPNEGEVPSWMNFGFVIPAFRRS